MPIAGRALRKRWRRWQRILPYSRNCALLSRSSQRQREMGFDHMGARFYQQGTGRFTQRDPLGVEVMRDNLFVYAANNPIVKIDPGGLSCSSDSRAGSWTVPIRIGRVQKYMIYSALGILPGGNTNSAPYYTTDCPHGNTPIISASGRADPSQIDKYYTKDAAPIVRRCALVHEAVHASQCKCLGEWGYSAIYTLDYPRMEYHAYFMELQCLTGNMSDAEINAIIQNIQQYIEY